jgi:hypothetical protein
MPVTLESRLRQIQVFNLPHEVFCKSGECACTDVPIVSVALNPRTGERASRQSTRRVCASLTLLAGERRSGLPAAVLDVPEIRAAISRHAVRVVEQSADHGEAPEERR